MVAILFTFYLAVGLGAGKSWRYRRVKMKCLSLARIILVQVKLIVSVHMYLDCKINDFIWEMSIRTISTKVEDVSHKKPVVR